MNSLTYTYYSYIYVYCCIKYNKYRYTQGEMMNIPSKSIDLIKVLDELYPDKMIIDDAMSDNDKLRLAGKVELIRLLKQNLDNIIGGDEEWQ